MRPGLFFKHDSACRIRRKGDQTHSYQTEGYENEKYPLLQHDAYRLIDDPVAPDADRRNAHEA
jgi:hypothetical protein